MKIQTNRQKWVRLVIENNPKLKIQITDTGKEQKNNKKQQ